MKTVYPAIIEKIDGQYYIEFPDLEGCRSWGDTLEETISGASEALEGYILSRLENNLEIKKPGDINKLSTDVGQIKTYICCDIEIKSTKPVKKTLTIPEWVNRLGIENNINFSQTLTEAIITKTANRV